MAFAHQFNPAFATEIWRIEPLPHQRIALYDKILTQDRAACSRGSEEGKKRGREKGHH